MTASSPLLAAIRSLRREPGLAAAIVTTMALAIGVTATMFELVTRLMLAAPPGIREPDRIARLVLQAESPDGQKYAMPTMSYPFFRTVATLTNAYSSVAAQYPSAVILGAGENAREIKSVAVTGQYFTTLGAVPSHGRFFGPADDELPSGNAVAVLNYAFWKSRFNSDLTVVNSTITLAGELHTVVGVAAPDFTGDNASLVDVFVPLSAAMRGQDSDWSTNANMNLVSVVARLRDGVTPTQAAGLTTALARAALDRRGIAAVQLESLMPGSARDSTQSRIALWLAGVAVLVLLIATANVGTLLLLRSVRTRRDVAVRLALGASRRHIAAQAITESLLLAMTGAAVGVVLSGWMGDLARVTLLPNLAPTDRLLDGRVLLAAMGLSLAAGIAAALGPILLVSRYSLTAELSGAGMLGSMRESRLQRLLIGVQVALCCVLLVGAGLFVRSLQRVQSQDLGFTTNDLLYVELDFRNRPTGLERDAVHFDAARRLRAMPGVVSATATQAMPFGHFHVPPISVPELATPPSADGQMPFLYASTSAYLELMGVKLLEGRLLTEDDNRGGAPLVVLVNATFAREVWPGQRAIGRCVRAGFDPDPSVEPTPMAPATLPCRTVVGVVRDSRVRSIRPTGREASLMQYYVPFDQAPVPPFAPDPASANGLLVKVTGDADRMAPAIQRMIQGTASSPVYARVRGYEDLVDPQMRPWRLGATLFVAFGVLAVCITAVGLFGVISYLVTQRTREIGLRLALGGSPSTIGISVVLRALNVVAAGVVVGMAVALVAGRYSQDLLFETSPADVGVLLLAAVTIVGVAFVASAWPAWRASRVSPMIALRSDAP
jgi:predicted permease